MVRVRTPHSYRLPIESLLEERGGRRGSPMVANGSSRPLSYRVRIRVSASGVLTLIVTLTMGPLAMAIWRLAALGYGGPQS